MTEFDTAAEPAAPSEQMVQAAVERDRRYREAVAAEALAARELARQAAAVFVHIDLGTSEDPKVTRSGLGHKVVVAREENEGREKRTHLVLVGEDGVLRSLVMGLGGAGITPLAEWDPDAQDNPIESIEIARTLGRAIGDAHRWVAFGQALFLRRSREARALLRVVDTDAALNMASASEQRSAHQLLALLYAYFSTAGLTWKSTWLTLNSAFLGMSVDEMRSAVEFLIEMQLITQEHGNSVRITSAGVRAAESALALPGKATERFPAVDNVLPGLGLRGN